MAGRCEGAACVVQGYGKVGAVAAHELARARGARDRGLATSPAGCTTPEGLDLVGSKTGAAEHGDLAGYPRAAEQISNAELLELPCDVLVLAATENQITGANAGRVSARLVVEGANGPTTLEADEILADRGIPVLPDILTNAGGVAVSYFEWVQDIQRLFWGGEEIRTRLGDLMRGRGDRVWTLADEESLSLRRAALVTPSARWPGRSRARGIYP